MGLLYTILNMVFPEKCFVCGETASELCLKCLSDAPGAERESEEWIFPLYDYRHQIINRSIKLLKYKGRRRLAKVFAQALYGAILEELAERRIMDDFREAILIPIPLSPKRRRSRGFNQAELICKELVEIEKSNLRHGVDANFVLKKNILIKYRDTPHQADIKDRKERLKNIVGCFSAGSEAKGRNIILLDDVTTTGATLREARKVLRRAGGRKIIAFTLAH